MVKMAILLLVAGLILSPQAKAGDPVNGQILYTANGCTGCHSVHLNAANAPNVITYAITTASGGQMAGFSVLTPTELADIAAYINTLLVNPISQAAAANTSTSFTIPSIDLVTNGFVNFTSIATQTAPAHGTVSFSGLNATYTPTTDYSGTDSFTYFASGPAGSTNVRTVNLTISAPPAPTVGARSVLVANSTATAIDLTSSISGSFTGIAVAAAPVHGATSVSGNIVTYTPTAGYTGLDSFTYTATGAGGTSAPATVSITVGAPAIPVASAKSVTVSGNTATAINLTGSISGFSSSVSVSVVPLHGTTSVSGNTVTYTPTTGYTGADSFSYTSTNSTGTSAAAIVSITVTPPAPLSADKAVTVSFNASTAIDLAGSISGTSTGVTLATNPQHGTAALSGTTVTYTPTAGYTGPDSFTYFATGPGGNSVVATVTITVTQLPPTAGATTMTVQLNSATTLDLAPFISGPTATGVHVSAAPGHGTVSVNGTKVTYTPNKDFFGADAFSYIAFSNTLVSSAAVVSVTVVGRPDPTKDAAVIGVINSQVDTARRFSRSQISNFQGRMESLHRRSEASASNAATSQGFASRASGTSIAAAASQYGNERGASQQDLGKPVGAAYQPAASLSGDASLSSVIGNALMTAGSAINSSSLNLAMSTGAPDGASPMSNSTNIWVGGGIKFGDRKKTAGSDETLFSTDGISIGVDRRFSEQLAMGVGVGYARDTTTIGFDGTNTHAKGNTIAVYGSYQPTEKTYIDGVLGYGTLDYQTDRYVTSVNDFAHSDRSGKHVFGSITTGYEVRANGLHLSPYGRLDYANDRLHQTSETGAGINALTYAEQSIPTLQYSLGLRAESAHEMNFGWVLPRLRVELQHDFQGEKQASVSYADLGTGSSFVLAPTTSSRNALVVGFGSDFVLQRGLTLSLDYQTQRTSGRETSQAIFFKLAQDLDGRSTPMSLLGSSFGSGSFKIDVDAGYTFDDNVTRASNDADVFSDRAYSLHFSKQVMRQLGEHTRLSLSGFVGGEKFHTYSGLSHIDAGADAEFQYRANGEFGTPIFGLFGSATAERYESDLRDGYRTSAGFSVRKPLTDRINAYFAVARNVRNADSGVFDTKDNSARLNLDYDLAHAGALYFRSEYRHGSIVSSGQPSLAILDLAKVFTIDDAFTRNDLYAYRLTGNTVLFTLGYNLPLGQKDSLDFSLRRARSTPSGQTGFAAWSIPRYVDNQFSIVYLTSF